MDAKNDLQQVPTQLNKNQKKKARKKNKAAGGGAAAAASTTSIAEDISQNGSENVSTTGADSGMSTPSDNNNNHHEEDQDQDRDQDHSSKYQEIVTSELSERDNGETNTNGEANNAELDSAQHEKNARNEGEEGAAAAEAALEVARSTLIEQAKQHKHTLQEIQENLNTVTEERDNFERQYKSLLDKVGQIRTTLGDRLKQDREELSKSRTKITSLEQQNQDLQSTISQLQEELLVAGQDNERLSRDMTALRGETEKSRINESRRLETQMNLLRREISQVNQASEDWKLLANEQRTEKESLVARNSELEEEILINKSLHTELESQHSQDHERIAHLESRIEQLELENESKLETVQSQLRSTITEQDLRHEKLEAQLKQVETEYTESKRYIEKLKPLEHQIKEKNLQIGKLRQEAVILNEHLTKALQILRSTGSGNNNNGSESDDGDIPPSIDRQLVTNLLLSFLRLNRGDTKRFEILQLISAVLGWNESQKEFVGLSRPRPGIESLRSPSLPSTTNNGVGDGGATGLKSTTESMESMASLWTEFLQRETSSSKN